jgi:hypothetical protein
MPRVNGFVHITQEIANKRNKKAVYSAKCL